MDPAALEWFYLRWIHLQDRCLGSVFCVCLNWVDVCSYCFPNTCTVCIGLLIFHAVAEPWNSGKSAKSREIHKNTQNIVKFGINLIEYMSVQHFWNLSQLLGLFTCHKLANLSWNFVTKTCKQRPKLPGVDYVAKNWVLAMMVKALPLVHFWSILLLKEQMMTSVRKTLKVLVWSAQNRSIAREICPENNHKIHRFFTDCSLVKFALENSSNNLNWCQNISHRKLVSIYFCSK